MIFTADAGTNLLTTASAHGLVDTTPLRVSSSTKLPAPLDPGRVYFARDTATAVDQLRLARWEGAPAVDLTDVGTGAHDLRTTRVSALDALFMGLEQHFADEGLDEVLEWGRRALTKQVNQKPGTRAGRVVVVPGDDTGKAGAFVPPRLVGMRPRTVAQWNEVASIHVWGRDATAPTDERAHYRVVRDLLEQVVRGLRKTAPGTYVLSDPTWTTEPVELVFGAELVVRVAIEGRLSDESPSVVHPPLAIDSSGSVMVFPDGDEPAP